MPDWLAYLDQNPDVKAYVKASGQPLEEGARQHYQLKGKNEHRTLPMKSSAVPYVPPPESLYYVYRSLQVEGFSQP